MYKLTARATERIPQNAIEKALKKVEKTFKKGIDKRKRMWYNNKVAAKRWRNDPWKLNNKREVQSIFVKNKVCANELNSKENTTQTKVKKAKSKTRKQRLDHLGRDALIKWFREFDPGSGWTLAACITHSSRTDKGLRSCVSGGRVSNAWATCLFVWDNVWKRTLIPHNA